MGATGQYGAWTGPNAGRNVGAISSLTSAISGVQGAAGQAQSIKDQMDFQSQQTAFNIEMAQLQGEDVIARGDEQAQKVKKAAGQLKGSQRAAAAAQGIGIDTGNVADMVADTERLSTEDFISIRNNAAREAFGYKAQAVSYGAQGAMNNLASQNQANNTILTGGLNFVRDAGRGYSDYKKYQNESRKAGRNGDY